MDWVRIAFDASGIKPLGGNVLLWQSFHDAVAEPIADANRKPFTKQLFSDTESEQRTPSHPRIQSSEQWMPANNTEKVCQWTRNQSYHHLLLLSLLKQWWSCFWQLPQIIIHSFHFIFNCYLWWKDIRAPWFALQLQRVFNQKSICSPNNDDLFANHLCLKELSPKALLVSFS